MFIQNEYFIFQLFFFPYIFSAKFQKISLQHKIKKNTKLSNKEVVPIIQ